MAPQFLVPETTVREAGSGPAMDLGERPSEALVLTLGITRIIEQESIDLSIWGSADGKDWGTKPIASFPQKFYCGTYQMQLPLADQSSIRYLRAQWQVNRWGRGDAKPLFGVYVFTEELRPVAVAAGV